MSLMNHGRNRNKIYEPQVFDVSNVKRKYSSKAAYDISDSMTDDTVNYISVDEPEYNKASKFVKAADILVSGTVAAQETKMLETGTDKEKMPYTIYKIEVKDKYKAVHGKSLEPLYCPTIDDVFEQLCTNEACEYAVVPVENMLDGYVQRTLDLLLEKNVYIVDENQVAVQFSLLANAEKIEDIRKIYVQFKTNGQCRQFLHTLHDAEIVTTNSNMESYYKIQDEPGTAAIVPHHVIQAGDVRVLAEDVTDAKGNHTRFIILRKGVFDVENPDLEKQLEELVSNEKGLDADADGTEKAAELTREKVRIPVYIMPATDRPGILFDILRRFYDKRINLISIMSRPTKQSMGTYNFYIEIDCLTERLEVVVETLRQIQVYNDVKILGAYKEH